MSIVLCQNSITGGRKVTRFYQVGTSELLSQREDSYTISSISLQYPPIAWYPKRGESFVILVDGVQVGKVVGKG